MSELFIGFLIVLGSGEAFPLDDDDEEEEEEDDDELDELDERSHLDFLSGDLEDLLPLGVFFQPLVIRGEKGLLGRFRDLERLRDLLFCP